MIPIDPVYPSSTSEEILASPNQSEILTSSGISCVFRKSINSCIFWIPEGRLSGLETAVASAICPGVCATVKPNAFVDSGIFGTALKYFSK